MSPATITDEAMDNAPVEEFSNAETPAPFPPLMVEEDILIVPLVEELFTPCVFNVVDEPKKFPPPNVTLLVPEIVKQVVVPARMSALIVLSVPLEAKVNPPPADDPPAAAVVSVARAVATPVPDPAPVAWKTTPTVLADAPMLVKEVVPTLVMRYHWPVTSPEETLTDGLLAPPIRTLTSRAMVNPLAVTVSPLPGNTPPFHVEVDDQLPLAIARATAMTRSLSPHDMR